MKKNVAGQVVGAEIIALDGSAFTGAVTVYVTGDNGAQAVGSVGSGACTHKGNGYHSYVPAQAETNYDHIAFTFVGAGAVPVTIQIYTTFPQSGDSYARIGAPSGASISADISANKITQMIDIKPVIPLSIDLADTATVRIGMMLINSVDDLPTTLEITPGTISIDRKAYGDTTWASIVTDAAMSEQDGMVYYDEVFDSASGYLPDDSIKITFKSVSITADANTYDIVGSSGVPFQTRIRHYMNVSSFGEIRIDNASADLVRQIIEDPDNMLYSINSRTVAALVNGRVPANTEAISGDTSAATNLKEHAKRAVPITFAAGGTTTTAILATVDGGAPNGASDLIYKNAALVFSAPAALKDQRALIQSYNAATNTVTITQVAATVGSDAVAVLV